MSSRSITLTLGHSAKIFFIFPISSQSAPISQAIILQRLSSPNRFIRSYAYIILLTSALKFPLSGIMHNDAAPFDFLRRNARISKYTHEISPKTKNIVISVQHRILSIKKSPRFIIRSESKNVSEPVSRVLSFKAIICLAAPLPERSCHLSELTPSKLLLSVLHRIGFTSRICLHSGGELLPRLSTLT